MNQHLPADHTHIVIYEMADPISDARQHHQEPMQNLWAGLCMLLLTDPYLMDRKRARQSGLPIYFANAYLADAQGKMQAALRYYGGADQYVCLQVIDNEEAILTESHLSLSDLPPLEGIPGWYKLYRYLANFQAFAEYPAFSGIRRRITHELLSLKIEQRFAYRLAICLLDKSIPMQAPKAVASEQVEMFPSLEDSLLALFRIHPVQYTGPMIGPYDGQATMLPPDIQIPIDGKPVLSCMEVIGQAPVAGYSSNIVLQCHLPLQVVQQILSRIWKEGSLTPYSDEQLHLATITPNGQVVLHPDFALLHHQLCDAATYARLTPQCRYHLSYKVLFLQRDNAGIAERRVTFYYASIWDALDHLLCLDMETLNRADARRMSRAFYIEDVQICTAQKTVLAQMDYRMSRQPEGDFPHPGLYLRISPTLQTALQPGTAMELRKDWNPLYQLVPGWGLQRTRFHSWLKRRTHELFLQEIPTPAMTSTSFTGEDTAK